MIRTIDKGQALRQLQQMEQPACTPFGTIQLTSAGMFFSCSPLFKTDSVRAAGAFASWLNGGYAESEIWKGQPDHLETPYGILEPAYGLPELV